MAWDGATDSAEALLDRTIMDFPPEVRLFFVDYGRSVLDLSPHTLLAYAYDWKQFLGFLAARGVALEQTTPRLIEEFRGHCFRERRVTVERRLADGQTATASVRRKNAARGVARKVAALRTVFRYLTKERRMFSQSPAADVEPPRAAGQKLPTYLDAHEAAQLLDAIGANANDPWLRTRDTAIVTLLLHAGLRVSELVGLDVTDFALDPGGHYGRVRVLGKGRKERLVPLTHAATEALLEYLDARPTRKLAPEHAAALFLTKAGRRITRHAVWGLVKKYAALARLDRSRLVSPHKLRHSAATMLYGTGAVDIYKLQKLLGHARVQTTEIYTHLHDAALEEAVRQHPLEVRPRRRRAD